jgi:DNA-directed RNA polymerase subunit RPC12/RpoP
MILTCSNCGYKLYEQPTGADTWTCPVCGTKNVIEAAPASENWLDGLCEYTGPGHDLPTGGYCKIPNWSPEKIVVSWMTVDGTEKKTSELTKDDGIIGATFNQKALEAIVSTYGKDFFQLREANGGPMLTLDQWQTKYGTNGLGLVAIRNMRMKLAGQGVHF